MCGIVGSISKKFNFSEEAIGALAHRGPDDQGLFYENGVTLGHRRLSIVDLSANGHQPMISSDGRYVIIYNGEIYNHQHIREKLLSKGYSFKSTSDTETLLNGYAEFGPAIVEKLNGIFAFAIYDRIKEEVFIGRDQFGIKPLYYYHKNEVFLFASEIKAFLSVPGFDRTVNTTALFYYLQLLYAPGELTAFEEVKKLLPGHTMLFKARENRFEIKRYYNIKFAEDKSEWNEDEYSRRLDACLRNAVKRQLMSDVPLGYFLSGGLDSSIIVALAKQLLPEQKLTCFSISGGPAMKKEGFADDEFYARKVAAHLGVELEIIPADLDILQRFDQMIWHLDEPQADPAPLHVQTISKGARERGIKVLLGGTAGDDLFSGYRRHQAVNLEKYFRYLPKPVSKLVQAGIDPLNESFPAFRRIKKIAREMNQSKLERMAGYFTWLPENSVMKLFSDDCKQRLSKQILPRQYYLQLLQQLPAGTADLNKLLYLELSTFLPDHNLNYTDKMSMSAGVEARVPFLDTELVAFASEMPVSLKMKGSTTKYLLRKVAEKYLPADVIYRPKTGFGAPVRQWVRKEMRSMIEERLNNETLTTRGLFDARAVQQLIRLNGEGKVDASYTIWSLLAIESWMQQFVDVA